MIFTGDFVAALENRQLTEGDFKSPKTVVFGRVARVRRSQLRARSGHVMTSSRGQLALALRPPPSALRGPDPGGGSRD